jgi:hypothetical protein
VAVAGEGSAGDDGLAVADVRGLGALVDGGGAAVPAGTLKHEYVVVGLAEPTQVAGA